MRIRARACVSLVVVSHSPYKMSVFTIDAVTKAAAIRRYFCPSLSLSLTPFLFPFPERSTKLSERPSNRNFFPKARSFNARDYYCTGDYYRFNISFLFRVPSQACPYAKPAFQFCDNEISKDCSANVSYLAYTHAEEILSRNVYARTSSFFFLFLLFNTALTRRVNVLIARSFLTCILCVPKLQVAVFISYLLCIFLR